MFKHVFFLWKSGNSHTRCPDGYVELDDYELSKVVAQKIEQQSGERFTHAQTNQPLEFDNSCTDKALEEFYINKRSGHRDEYKRQSLIQELKELGKNLQGDDETVLRKAAELIEKPLSTVISTYGDGWYDGFLAAKEKKESENLSGYDKHVIRELSQYAEARLEIYKKK